MHTMNFSLMLKHLKEPKGIFRKAVESPSIDVIMAQHTVLLEVDAFGFEGNRVRREQLSQVHHHLGSSPLF